MTAEDELKTEVGSLLSQTGPRPMVVSMGVSGPETPEQKIAALESDVQALYRGILLAGRQIEDLRSKISGG
jgi:hypothetical protein